MCVLLTIVLCFFFYFLLKFIYFNWRLITLQYCSGFCHTLTWISRDGKDDPIGETIVFLTITKIFFSDNRGHMHVIYPPCKLQPMNHHMSLVSAPVFISWEMLEKRHSKHKRPPQEIMGRQRKTSIVWSCFYVESKKMVQMNLWA